MPPAAAIAGEGTTVASSSGEVGCTTTTTGTGAATETTNGATEIQEKCIKERKKEIAQAHNLLT